MAETEGLAMTEWDRERGTRDGTEENLGSLSVKQRPTHPKIGKIGGHIS
jgi:hypothetical protein